MQPSKAGEDLIKTYEGFAKVRPDGMVEAYPDPGTGGAPFTIGYGSTGPDITEGTVWTRQQCEDRFDKHLQHFAADVNALIGDTPTTQGQFDAMLSFHYNTGALLKSTLGKLHKAGKYELAAAEFPKWVRAGNKVLPGLVRRRAAERAMYELK